MMTSLQFSPGGSVPGSGGTRGRFGPVFFSRPGRGVWEKLVVGPSHQRECLILHRESRGRQHDSCGHLNWV